MTYKPTAKARKSVEEAAARGVTQDCIADCLGIHRDTMVKHYGEVWKKGYGEAVDAAAGILYQKVLDGENEMVKFFLKTRANYSETNKTIVAGDADNPLEQKWTVEFINATPKAE